MTNKRNRIFARNVARPLDTEALRRVGGGQKNDGGGGRTGSASLCGDDCNVYDDCDL